MERIGVHHYNAESFLLASLNCESIIVEGVFSHFARADETDLSSALLQLERFNQVLEFYDEKKSTYSAETHIKFWRDCSDT